MNTPLSSLRHMLNQLPDIMGQAWTNWRHIVLDDLHHTVDRRLPYFLHQRRGAPRIAFKTGRDEQELLARLSGIERTNHTRGIAFVKDVVDELLEQITMIVAYVVRGEERWLNPAQVTL